MITEPRSTYVSVSVPERLLERVYDLLLQDLQSSSGSAAQHPAHVRDNGHWRQHEIDELARRLTHPGGRAVLDVIARSSLDGQAVSYEEMRAAAAEAMSEPGYTYDQLRGQLSWIGRYSKAIRGARQWPLEFTDRGASQPTGERYRYSMPPQVAEWWLQASER